MGGANESDSANIAERIRAALSGAGLLREVKMFGGIGFMLNGNMVAALSKRGVLLRVGAPHQDHALDHAGTRIMEMNGRPMKGYVQADPHAVDEATFEHLLRLAIAYTASLPPKS